jgi:hypothetical protein
LGNDDKVYNLCFRDPMLLQWDTRRHYNDTHRRFLRGYQ